MNWCDKIHKQLADAKAVAFATGKRGNESGIQRSFMGGRMTSTESKPFCFVVVCMCCGKEKSREARENYTKDVISHGICTPLCDESKAAGWGKWVTKANGGDV